MSKIIFMIQTKLVHCEINNLQWQEIIEPINTDIKSIKKTSMMTYWIKSKEFSIFKIEEETCKTRLKHTYHKITLL